ALFDFPQDCRGMRVLDIGTRDGYFAFECERRGAEVLAVDYFPAEQTGFAIAARLLNSSVEYRQKNMYELSAAELGQFDKQEDVSFRTLHEFQPGLLSRPIHAVLPAGCPRQGLHQLPVSP
ncbi:MAG: class I SAM-dependent methyltransferase, partial [Verrucomicrobium sp.]